MAAAQALASQAPALSDPTGALLPPLSKVHEASDDIALAVAKQAQAEALAEASTEEVLIRRLAAKRWQPVYPRLRPHRP